MRLQTRIVLAQLPALAAVLALLVWGGHTVAWIGSEGRRVLADNYRSVIAAQRMGQAVEQLDRLALARVAGHPDEVTTREQRPLFERELVVEENNVTEEGERDVARVLRRQWEDYLAHYDAFLASPEADRGQLYFDTLAPAARDVVATTEALQALNQEAIHRQSDRTEERVRDVRRLWLAGSLVGVAVALGLGTALSHRVTGPLRALAGAAAGVGEGRLDVRLPRTGMAELDQLADAFHRMAEGLRAYRRTSQSELARASETAQAAIESLADPVLVLSPEGALVTTNAAGRRLLGDPPDLALADADLADAVEEARQDVLHGRGGEVPGDFSGVVAFPTVDGERAVLPHGTPIHDPLTGELVGVTVLLQDVTRLRRLDELKGSLVQTAAHELRTPLTSLGMALHLARDARVRGSEEKVEELLSAAQADVRRLTRVVEDLLDLSRIQAGRMVLRTEPVASSVLLGDVRDAVQAAADEKGVAIEIYAPPDPPPRLDRARMALALTNLAANAVRHSPAGGKVRLAAIPIPEGLRFEVEDEGPGVPPGEEGRIFEPFVRGRLEKGAGAGLGLFIAREVAQAHGGRIGVEAGAGGRGARFFVELT